MRKFKIFLFIEACLLTGALILMVSEHFSRFLLILFLFLLLIRYYTGKEGNNLLLVVATILFFFIVMLNPFVIFSYFCCGYIQPLSSLSDDEPGKRADQFGV
ncbi:Transporter associated with VraSR [Streptococcus mitis]|uniref:Transporter associated with VraSR n=1 Tax=Streptococcus mitis TaxID=28037 RepID=A0A150NLI7_STRMT|nr:Transporter associated with VraSR [Streptococcus mitis]